MSAPALLPSPAEVAAARERWPEAFGAPVPTRLLTWAALAAFGLFVAYALDRTGFFDVAKLGEGFSRMLTLASVMWPPAHNGWLGEFLEGIAETLAMAFLGTFFATLLAVPLGFLGARNMVPGWLLHFTLRRSFDGLRGIDTLIWALIFINVVGLGPFAGILAIIASDTGTLAKLFAEAVENVDRNPVDGVRSAGASGAQTVRFAVVPQVLPVMLSNALYFFESNTRSATILGIVGAGGIGLQLSARIRVNNWDEVSFIVILILATVYAIDQLSRLIRERLIGGHRLVA